MMHGEYKVPGGKLVVADVLVEAGQISELQISGDFFLEPEEALADIAAALVGKDITGPAKEWGDAVKGALPEDVQMFGFSAEAVVIAVRRALGLAKTWYDFEWQMVYHKPVTPLMHVALDEVLALEVAKGNRPPTLRFWEWDRAAVIIGAFQSVKNEVDADAAKALDVEIVRRATGGGAMFVEKGNSITYSLYAPSSLVADMNFADSYAFLDNWVLKALNELGVEAFYQPLNDITGPKGKIGGAAQKRFANETVLHHVTMAYDMDPSRMTQVLRIGREKLSDKGTASAAKRVDPLRSQTGMDRSDIIQSLMDTFSQLNGAVMGEVTEDEYQKAEALVKEKYGTDEWLYKLP